MQLLSRIRRLRDHKLTRDAVWLALGRALNFFVQATFFILLARVLGATQYGIFAGVYALVNTVTPFSALGSGLLFMRYVTADNDSASVYWGNSLATTTVMTVLIGGLFIFIGPAITRIHSIPLVLHLVIANCLFSQVVTIASRVFQTYRRMRLTAALTTLCNLTRLIVLVIIWLAMRRASAVQWSLGVLIASAVSAIIAILMVRRVVRGISLRPRLILSRFWEGITFTTSSASQTGYNDLDKTLLSHYGLNFQNGFYTLAYRIVDFSSTPVGAIDMAVLPRYFQLSKTGLRPVLRLAFKSIRTAALLSISIAVCVWFIAPIVPRLAGRDFAGAVIAMHWLCIIPIFRAIHTVGGSALTGTGRQNIRVVLQFSIALLNLTLNLWWIPLFGWFAAVWSSLASDGMLAILTAGTLFFLWRRAARLELASALKPA